MAKVLCSLSGIEFDVTHFNIYLQSRESHHPIFNLSAPALISLAPKWINQEFSNTENYLYYLSLFKSTGLMEFRVPAMITADIFPIIAQNMHHLIQMVEKLIDASDARKQEILSLPTFVITPDTKDLLDSPEWIKIWHHNYKEYLDSYKSATLAQKINHKESILERHIKDRTKDISLYAHQLASWAALAGKFPTWDVDVSDIPALKTSTVTMSEYWQYIIKACARTEAIWEVPHVDLEDLVEHCEMNIEHGSIYAHTLMSLLRSGKDKKKDFIDLGDIDISSKGTTFRILDSNASVEDANKQAMIDSAPIEMPVESKYPNKAAFLVAKAKYRMAMAYKESEVIRQKLADHGIQE